METCVCGYTLEGECAALESSIRVYCVATVVRLFSTGADCFKTTTCSAAFLPRSPGLKNCVKRYI